LEDNLKTIKDVMTGLSADFLALVKGESLKVSNSVLNQVIQRKEIDDAKIVEVFSFLINQTAQINKIQEKIVAKKQEQKSKESTEAFNPRKDMSNMTPEEVAVHRSISISS